MWEYYQRKFGLCWRRKTTTMRPWQKGRRGAIKAYGWVGRTIHLMISGIMEKVRKIVVLTGSMQKTFLKQTIATLARSEAKSTIQLCCQKHRPSLSA